MAEAGDYIVVHFVKPVAVGYRFERRRAAWPLHITLVPWFYGAMDAPLWRALQIVAQPIMPSIVHVGTEAFFGPTKAVPVNVISNPEVLHELHESLLAAVQTAEGVIEHPEFISDNYVPHITQHNGDQRRHEGDEVRVADFHLVQLGEQNICEVIAQFPLGKQTPRGNYE